MNLRGELYLAAVLAAGSGWRRHLQEIQRSAPGEIPSNGLPRLLKHAIEHVPYYRSLGISEPGLESFPILTRQTLRAQFEHLKSEGLDRRKWQQSSTGGSTGEPVWTIQDPEFLQWDYATDLYYMHTFYGMSYQDYLRSRRVVIWHQRRRRRVGTGLLKRAAARLLGRILYVEPYEALSEASMAHQLRRINRHRPEMILAFAATMHELANHAIRTGTSLHKPRFIICSIEMLFPRMRETIERAFQCPVYNMYGAAEVGRVAAECSEQRLHLLTFNNHVEILDSNGLPTPPAEVGRIVATPLHNFAMPLIRYDIGDLARVDVEPCPCGSPLPTVHSLQGRVIDHFVRSDGSLVFGGNFIAMFYEHDWIRQLYVLQEEIGRIRISFTREPGKTVPDRAFKDLTEVVRRTMGTSCKVIWEEVESIPRSPMGKHLHARSLVREEQLKAERSSK